MGRCYPARGATAYRRAVHPVKGLYRGGEGQGRSNATPPRARPPPPARVAGDNLQHEAKTGGRVKGKSEAAPRSYGHEVLPKAGG